MSSDTPSSPLQQLEVQPPGTVRLREDEQSLVEEECILLLSQPLPERAKQTYEALSSAATGGAIPADLEEPLQALLEVGMESGRIRSLHGAHAEMAATRLYARLPRGKIYAESIRAANEALKALAGQELVDASFQAGGPGSCKLMVDTGSRRITIRIKRTGLSVESVEAVV